MNEQYPLNLETRVSNVLGQVVVFREVLTALLAAAPNGRGIIALALQNGEQLADAMLATSLPEGVLAAMQLELNNLRTLSAHLAQRDGAQTVGTAPAR